MHIVATSDVSWASGWKHTAGRVCLRIEGLISTNSRLIIGEIRKDGLLLSLSSKALRSVHGIICGRIGADSLPYSTLTVLAHLHLEALILGQMLITAGHWSTIMQILV